MSIRSCILLFHPGEWQFAPTKRIAFHGVATSSLHSLIPSSPHPFDHGACPLAPLCSANVHRAVRCIFWFIPAGRRVEACFNPASTLLHSPKGCRSHPWRGEEMYQCSSLLICRPYGAQRKEYNPFSLFPFPSFHFFPLSISHFSFFFLYLSHKPRP